MLRDSFVKLLQIPDDVEDAEKAVENISEFNTLMSPAEWNWMRTVGYGG